MLNALIERAKNLILKPAETWDVISDEETDVPTLYKTWVIPLAAIPAIAGFIGMSLIGVSVFGVYSRVPILNGLVNAVVTFGLSLAWVYVVALIIDALAPTFGAEKNFKQAIKVSAYAPTASWLAGIFMIIPALSVLSIVGLYSLYLLFVGLPKLMQPAEGKAGVYTITVLVISVVILLVISLLTAPLGGASIAAR